MANYALYVVVSRIFRVTFKHLKVKFYAFIHSASCNFDVLVGQYLWRYFHNETSLYSKSHDDP